jgi:hypothetical protein
VANVRKAPDADCVVGAWSMQIGEGAKARLAPDFESSEVGGILHVVRRESADFVP